MKFKGTLIAQASGSLAGLTFSHNRGGQYIRARTTPVNPATAFQVAIRNTVAALTSTWQNVLTAVQRTAWETYAVNVPLSDTLGEPRNAGGLGMYVRTNVPRIQNSVARLDVAPTNFDLGSFTNPSITSVTSATGILLLAFTNTDAWAAAAGGYLFLYASRQQSPSINYFKGPYRLAGKIAGAGTPPTSPGSFTVPFAVAVGNHVFVQLRVMQVDGRLSAPFRLVGTGV